MKQLLKTELYSDDVMMILNQSSEQFREEIALQLLDHLNYQALELIKERAEDCMETLFPTKKDTAKVPEIQEHYNTDEEKNPCLNCQYNKHGLCESYLPCMRKDTGRMSDD